MSMTNEQLLEFSEIKKYLDLAIGKKKAKIGSNLTLKQKIKSVNLSQYLRGISYFFEYSKLFKNPSEIMDFWKKYRDNDDKVNELYKEITNFPIWLKTEKQLGDSTCVSYQAHIRGFLSNNNIKLTFKNYKPDTQKRKSQNKLGITYEEMKDFAEKVKTYITDIDLKLLCEFLHRTGLAYKEIADMTFGLLRNKDYNQEYILIADIREKTSVDYVNFISPKLQELISDFLRINTDKKDSDKLFGNDTKEAYHNLNRRFNTAYEKCCMNHFPRFLKIKTSKDNLKKLFSLHSFRAIFKSACDKLKIISENRDLFIAHTSEKMTNYDLRSEELLNDYKLIEAEIFGTKQLTDNETLDKLFDMLRDLVQNKGKSKAIFRKYQENQDIELDNEIKAVLFLEQFKLQFREELKSEILNDVKTKLDDFKKELESYKKDIISNLSLKDLLLAVQ